jgi:WXG100 family type VII secretion target
MTIRLEHPEFHASVAEVRRTAAELADARALAAREVDLLMDAWRGAAAETFAEAWERWLTASRSVSEGLASLADGLEAFQTGVMTCDASTAASLRRLP